MRTSELLALIHKDQNNKYCADCGSFNPRWVSINIGCVICIECSGIHRSLGSHISSVRSIGLDDWTPEMIEYIKNRGNTVVNKEYEATLPPNFKRPSSSDTHNITKFITQKYVYKDFYTPLDKSSKTEIASTDSAQSSIEQPQMSPAIKLLESLIN